MEVKIKIRETTRESSFTIPLDHERKMEFFFGTAEEPCSWDVLHVVCKSSKQLLCIYTRAQVFAIVNSPRAVRRMSRNRVPVCVISVAK
jgi:hypothetical protein